MSEHFLGPKPKGNAIEQKDVALGSFGVKCVKKILKKTATAASLVFQARARILTFAATGHRG